MYILGNCPYCKDGKIEIRKVSKGNHKINVYACSNAHWKKECDDFWELTEDSTCNYSLRQDALQKYGKRSIKKEEMKSLIKEGELEVELYSGPKKTHYKKFIIMDLEYGVSVLF